FLKEVDIHVSKFIFQRAETHLKKVCAQHNPILRYGLTGDFGTLLPHYLQPANYHKVKANLDRLVISRGFAEQIAQEYGLFDHINRSTIFEHMKPQLFHEAASKLVHSLNPEEHLDYWNLIVSRRVSDILPSIIRCIHALSEQLT